MQISVNILLNVYVEIQLINDQDKHNLKGFCLRSLRKHLII